MVPQKIYNMLIALTCNIFLNNIHNPYTIKQLFLRIHSVDITGILESNIFHFKIKYSLFLLQRSIGKRFSIESEGKNETKLSSSVEIQ